MPPFLQFVIRRFLVVPISLVIITMVLYGGVMLTPPEARATLYYPSNMRILSEERLRQFTEVIIARQHLRDPFLVQYGYWVVSLFDGTWGYSPSMREDVLPALLKGTPITLELGIYSLLLLIPLGLVSGVVAGWRRSGSFDRLFRGVAFVSTSVPSFILALVLLSVFYVQLDWFAPGRLSYHYSLEIAKNSFMHLTGMLT